MKPENPGLSDLGIGEKDGPLEKVYLHYLSGEPKNAVDFGTFPERSPQDPTYI